MTDGFLIITICSLPCVASGIALYRLAHHGQVIRRLARSKVPAITQSVELTSFNKQISDHFAAFEFCSFLAFALVATSIILLFFCSTGLQFTTSLLLYLCYVAVMIVQSQVKKRERATVTNIVRTHPGRNRSDLLQKMQGLAKFHQSLATDEQAVAVPDKQTFDNPALELRLDNLPAASAMPVRSLAEERTLIRAHQQALNDSTLTVDEPMIAIFKDKEQKLRILMAKAELVWQPHNDTSGKQIAGRVFCAGVNFSGAKIAHFDGLAWPETEVNAFTHAWIATKENTHILLTTLWWLSDDQRIVIYELINPGQTFPVDWLSTAASRGSWQ